MGQYLIRRLLLMIPTLFGITLLTFCIVRLAPGDPIESKFGGGDSGPSASGGGSNVGGTDRSIAIKRTKINLGMLEEKGTVRVWNLATGESTLSLSEHETEVNCLAVSPVAGAGNMLAVASKGKVSLWSGDGAKLLGTILIEEGKTARDINQMVFSPDGKLLGLATSEKVMPDKKKGTAGGYFARIYNVEDPSAGTEVAKLELHPRTIGDISWSPDSKYICTTSAKSLFIWDSENFKLIRELTDHVQDVNSAQFSPDSKQLLSGGDDRYIYSHDVADWTATRLKKLPAIINSLACSPDGNSFAVALDNRTIRLLSTETHDQLASMEGHTARIRDLSFGPNSQTLLSGADDKQVIVWDLVAKTNRFLSGHSDEVTAVSFSRDGKLAFSGAIQVHKVGLIKSYFKWLWRLRNFDFGRSLKDDQPVNEKIKKALPITLKLNLWSIFLTYLIAIPIGVFAAARRGIFDHLTSVVLFFLYSMPSFWVATLLVLLFGSPTGFSAKVFDYTLPIIGLHSDNAPGMTYLCYLTDHYLHLVLPLIAMTYSSFAFLSRLVRSGMLDGLSQDYVRTAKAKGLPPIKVVGVHALRNSMISVVTVFGNILPAMIGGSVIIERIFSIRGMGMLAFDGILQRDYPVIMATTTMAAILTLFGILLSDILYKLVDPRIQLK